MATERLDRFEERLHRRRRIALIPRTRLVDRDNPYEFYDCIQFKIRYHMYKDTALYITGLISDELVSPLKRGCQFSPQLQFLIVARFFATGSFQIVLGDVHKVTQSTISVLVKRVSRAIASHCQRFVKFPTHESAKLVRENFYKIRGFPGVVGALDCTHVKIDSPGGETAELYRDRKDMFSLNVQAICDADLIFTNIVSKWYGSAHDTRIFENSRIMAELESGKAPGLILGDNGYPLLPYLMTPMARPHSNAEKRYNIAQIATRNPIERCFGVLKRRFPCLRHLRVKIETAKMVVVATVVLHNILRSRRDIFENDTIDENDDLSFDSGINSPPPLSSSSGKRIQTDLILNHFA